MFITTGCYRRLKEKKKRQEKTPIGKLLGWFVDQYYINEKSA